MNGNKYFLDTNALIALLKGDDAINISLSAAGWIGTSSICIIEFLSYSQLDETDKSLLYKLVERIEVIPVSSEVKLLDIIAQVKLNFKLKLPDAIIASSSLSSQSILISNDKHFEKIEQIRLQKF